MSSPRAQTAAVFAAVAAAGLLLAAAALLARASDVPLLDLVRDPTAAAGVGAETGIVARVEVLIWGAGAGAALVAGWALRGGERGRMLLGFGGLTAALTVDDALLVHESLTDRLGVPVLEPIYALAVAALCWRLREPLLARTPWRVLAAAIFWLSASVAVDVAYGAEVIAGADAPVVEEALKVCGVLSWSLWLALATASAIEGPADHDVP